MTDRATRATIEKPGSMPGFFLLVILTACGDGGTPADESVEAEPAAGIAAQMRVAGELENEDIDEASGLVHSRRSSELLWTHNDSGARARLYAIDPTGRQVGRLRLEDADNVDWEDIAAFGTPDNPWLVVADIGDNEARRSRASLYVVEEPDLSADDKPELSPERRIEFRYPDGPRDAEAVAVDGNRVLIMSKRDLPPRLYAVSLVGGDEVVDAEFLGTVDTLPMPSRRDIEFAPSRGVWHWQPTAMDIAPDESAIVVLTYAAVYYYRHAPGEDWYETLSRPPLAYRLGNIRNAEAAGFGADSRSIYVTVEDRNAALYRIDLLEAP